MVANDFRGDPLSLLTGKTRMIDVQENGLFFVACRRNECWVNAYRALDEDGRLVRPGASDLRRPRGVAEPTIEGTGGDDVLWGTLRPDGVFARVRGDRIEGGRRDDLICGADGHDRIRAGPVTPCLRGTRCSASAGPTRFTGRLGDRLRGGAGELLTGAGDGLIDRPGEDQVFGGPGPDGLIGEQGDDLLKGGSGRDRLSGSIGSETLRGGPGDDSLFGQPGPDDLRGGPRQRHHQSLPEHHRHRSRAMDVTSFPFPIWKSQCASRSLACVRLRFSKGCPSRAGSMTSRAGASAR